MLGSNFTAVGSKFAIRHSAFGVRSGLGSMAVDSAVQYLIPSNCINRWIVAEADEIAGNMIDWTPQLVDTFKSLAYLGSDLSVK